MTEPRQPSNPPPPEAETETDPHGHAPNGIPRDSTKGQPAGSPTDQRHETETAANKSED